MQVASLDHLIVAYSVRVVGLTFFFAIFPALRTFLGVTPLAAISAVLTLACTPDSFFSADAQFYAEMSSSPHSSTIFVMVVTLSLLRNFFFALPLLIALEVFGLAARVVDSSRGAQYAEQISPLMEGRVSYLEHSASFALAVLVFFLGGYQLFFQAARSCLFGPMPIGEVYFGRFLSLFFGSGMDSMIDPMLRLFAHTLASGISIGAPVMFACFLLDLLGGIIGRVVSPSSVSSEIQSIKLVLGLFLGMYTLWFLSDNVSSLFVSALRLQCEYLQFFELPCSAV